MSHASRKARMLTEGWTLARSTASCGTFLSGNTAKGAKKGSNPVCHQFFSAKYNCKADSLSKLNFETR